MIGSYLLNPSRHRHSLEELSREYLDRLITYSDVAGSGAKAIPFSQEEVEKACRYSGKDADLTLQLAQLLMPKIEADGFADLFQGVELPLIEVLAAMEMTGVRLDLPLLEVMSREFEIKMDKISAEIFDLAGESFNINSPQQLGKILFERLKLPGGKRTKTGYSTDVEVLNELSRDFPLPAKVLEYRSLSKLKSTYVDALPQMVHPKTGRIHTSFNQTVTATGRLSSSDPNLQNIPIRSPEGRRIREAFIPEEGCWILSADYSQIELRILAHLSQPDPLLLATFQQDQGTAIKGEESWRRRTEIRRVECGVPRSRFLPSCSPCANTARAQAPASPPQDQLTKAFHEAQWTEGPATAPLERIAEVVLPLDFLAAQGNDTRRIMEAMHNPPTGREVGVVFTRGANWFVVFEFEDVGYVKDDEKVSLDADAMLESIKRGTEAGNQERARRGWPPLTIVGWEQKPYYDPQTHNLTWAIRGESRGGAVINYNTRLLGRRGVMRVTLVTDPAELQAAIPQFQSLRGCRSSMSPMHRVVCGVIRLNRRQC